MSELTNHSIFLRAMEPEDIDAIFRWENDPKIWVDSASHQPFSRKALSQFIEENSGADIYSCRQLRLMAEKEEIIKCDETGELHKNVFCKHFTVGCVDLFDFDPYHRRAGVGIIVDNHYRRQGIGLQMLLELEDFGREHLQLHQLHCAVASNNKASIALFERAGYSRCGVLNEWIFSDGKWIDAFMYQKIITLS